MCGLGVSLIATKAFRYDSRSLTTGDAFDAVTERDAHLLRTSGLAKDPPQKRWYQSRELSSGDAPSGDSPDTSKPRRQYRRRDLQPER